MKKLSYIVIFGFMFFTTHIFAAAGTVTVIEKINIPDNLEYQGTKYEFAAGHWCANAWNCAANFSDATTNTTQQESFSYNKKGDAFFFELVDVPQTSENGSDPLPAIFHLDSSCAPIQLQCYGGIGQCTNPNPITPKIASPTLTFNVNYQGMQHDQQTEEDLPIFNVSCVLQGF